MSMEKIKSFVWFSAKVFLAGAVINLILGFLPSGIASWLAMAQRDPKALIGGSGS